MTITFVTRFMAAQSALVAFVGFVAAQDGGNGGNVTDSTVPVSSAAAVATDTPIQGGVIAAIVLGVALLFACIGFGVWYYRDRQRYQRDLHLQSLRLQQTYDLEAEAAVAKSRDPSRAASAAADDGAVAVAAGAEGAGEAGAGPVCVLSDVDADLELALAASLKEEKRKQQEKQQLVQQQQEQLEKLQQHQRETGEYETGASSMRTSSTGGGSGTVENPERWNNTSRSSSLATPRGGAGVGAAVVGRTGTPFGSKSKLAHTSPSYVDDGMGSAAPIAGSWSGHRSYHKDEALFDEEPDADDASKSHDDADADEHSRMSDESKLTDDDDDDDEAAMSDSACDYTEVSLSLKIESSSEMPRDKSDGGEALSFVQPDVLRGGVPSPAGPQGNTLDSIMRYENGQVVINEEALRRLARTEKCNKCPVCVRKFTRLANLVTHMKEIHGKVKGFQCNICKKTFARKYNMQVHQRTHMKATKRPHVCKVCGERFSQRSNLKRHALVRHEKRGKCPRCEERFDNDSDFERHWNEKHPGETVKFMKKIALRVRQNNLRCICSKQFEVLKELKAHQAACGPAKQQAAEARREEAAKSAAAASAAAAEHAHQQQQQQQANAAAAAAGGDSSASRSPSAERVSVGNATVTKEQLAAAMGMAPGQFFRSEQDLVNAFRHLIQPSASANDGGSAASLENGIGRERRSMSPGSGGSDLADQMSAHVSAAVALQSLHQQQLQQQQQQRQQQQQQNNAMSDIQGGAFLSQAAATHAAATAAAMGSGASSPLVDIANIMPPLGAMTTELSAPQLYAMTAQAQQMQQASAYNPLQAQQIASYLAHQQALGKSATDLPSLDALPPLSMGAAPNLDSSAAHLAAGDMSNAALLRAFSHSSSVQSSIPSISPPLVDQHSASVHSSSSHLPPQALSSPALTHHTSAPPLMASLDPSSLEAVRPPSQERSAASRSPAREEFAIPAAVAAASPMEEAAGTAASPMASMSTAAAISEAITFPTLAMLDTSSSVASSAALSSLPMSNDAISGDMGAISSIPPHIRTQSSTLSLNGSFASMSMTRRQSSGPHIGDMPPTTSMDVFGGSVSPFLKKEQRGSIQHLDSPMAHSAMTPSSGARPRGGSGNGAGTPINAAANSHRNSFSMNAKRNSLSRSDFDSSLAFLRRRNSHSLSETKSPMQHIGAMPTPTDLLGDTGDEVER